MKRTREFNVRTGAELKDRRKAAKLSRRLLAKKAGVHHDTVKYWEGKPTLDPRGWAPKRLAEALGLMIFPAPKRARVRACHGVLPVAKTVPKPVLPPKLPPLASGPKRKRRVICGAKTRKGTRCRAKSEPGRKRCKLHGGESTGPRTPEGRARIAEAQRRRWRAYRAEARSTEPQL